MTPEKVPTSIVEAAMLATPSTVSVEHLRDALAAALPLYVAPEYSDFEIIGELGYGVLLDCTRCGRDASIGSWNLAECIRWANNHGCPKDAASATQETPQDTPSTTGGVLGRRLYSSLVAVPLNPSTKEPRT